MSTEEKAPWTITKIKTNDIHHLVGKLLCFSYTLKRLGVAEFGFYSHLAWMAIMRLKNGK